MVLQNATAQETSIGSIIGTEEEKKKRCRSGKRKTQEEITAPLQEEIKSLKSQVRDLQRRAERGAEGELIQWKQAAEELRKKREKEHRYSLKCVQSELVKGANLSAYNSDKRTRAAELKLSSVQRQLDRQTALLQELELEVAARVGADEHDGVLEQLADERRVLQNLEADLQTNESDAQAAREDHEQRIQEKEQQLHDMQHELDQLNASLADTNATLASLTAGPGSGRRANTAENFQILLDEVGIDGTRKKVGPPFDLSCSPTCDPLPPARCRCNQRLLPSACRYGPGFGLV